MGRISIAAFRLGLMAPIFPEADFIQAVITMVQRTEQQAGTASPTVSISPRSFKRQLELVLKTVCQQQGPVKILAKLPQGQHWLEDLRRYSQAAKPFPEIYLLSRQPLEQADWVTVIPIPRSHAMRGHYYLVLCSEAMALMIHGQRQTEASPTNSLPPSEGETEDALAESQTASQRVHYRLTLQPTVVRQTLAMLQQIVQASLREHPHQAGLMALLAQWDQHFPVPDQCHWGLLEDLLMTQTDYQEGLQRKARAYRAQAMTASNLSSQNEALMTTLRLKDDFLSTVGQALRTPLSTIKTALPLLASPNLKPPQRQRYLEMISQECDRQSHLISGILDLLQIERSLATVTPTPVKLFDVVPGVVSTYQPLAQEKGIRLAYTVSNALPPICCPETWLRQIVIHLLNNSIRYTEPGGEVWVTAQVEDDDSLLLNVRDTGIGIPAQDLPHIFEHFYRGRQTPDEEGAGLGLTIVQQLLLYCGGEISVDSQPEVGTHFRVKLPIYHPH